MFIFSSQPSQTLLPDCRRRCDDLQFTGKTTEERKRLEHTDGKSFNIILQVLVYADGLSKNMSFMLNIIITMGKYHVHKSKWNNSKPSLNYFKNECKKYLKHFKIINLLGNCIKPCKSLFPFKFGKILYLYLFSLSLQRP